MCRRHTGSAGRALCAAALLGIAIAGCAPASSERPDPFAATGELIAMGGAAAGAQRACFTCHGLQGEGDGAFSPRLAGFPVGYLQKQLEDYATGRRPDAVMTAIAKALGPSDRRKVAAYYAGLTPPAIPSRDGLTPGTQAAALYHAGDSRRGLPACADCHGAMGEGIGPANPPLAGQPAAYLEAQLDLWKAAKRRNDPMGVMLGISQRLTGAEIEALARYARAPSAGTAPPSGLPEASP